MVANLEEKFIETIKSDAWLMEILHQVKMLKLENWAVAAGSVRSSVWDYLHGFKVKTLPPKTFSLHGVDDAAGRA